MVRRHVGKAAPQAVLEHTSCHLAHAQGLKKPLLRREFSQSFYIDLVSAPLVFVHGPKSSISFPISLPSAPVFANIEGAGTTPLGGRKVATIKSAFRQGKVRDIYDLGDKLLLVATDRVSAYDSIIPTPIPGKGIILTQMSLFWFARMADVVPNHIISADVRDFPDVGVDPGYLAGRSVLVKKAEVVPIECVVRGYLAGSGWQEYRESGTVAGHALPEGLSENSELPQPLFTPSTKAENGHDENITVEQMEGIVGPELTAKLKELSIVIYTFARQYAKDKGIIIADTKFEFGKVGEEVILIDEVLTPDSSRFWPAQSYAPGSAVPSYDKQYVRDYLDTIGWDHHPPAPELPADVVEQTAGKYRQAFEQLTLHPSPFEGGG